MFEQEIKNPWVEFEKRLGTSGAGGQFYERELAMLMLLQGVTKKRSSQLDQFYLATNMKKLGDFDDIAFKYMYCNKSGKENAKVIFLQAKHKINPMKGKEMVTLNRLLSDSDRKDAFALREYFSSFMAIKRRFTEKYKEHPIFGGEFKDCDFVIYTNAMLHQSFTGNDSAFRKIEVKRDYMLHFGEDCSYYQLVFGDNKELDQKVKYVLEYSSNCKKLAKALVKSFFPSSGNKCAELTNQGVIKKYHWCLAQKIIEIVKMGEGKVAGFFLDDEGGLSVEDKIFKDALFHEMNKIKEHSSKSTDELNAILKETRFKIPKDFGDVKETTEKLALPTDSVSEQDIKDFLRKLKLFLGQPNYTKLSKIIKKQIQERYKVMSKVDVENIFSKVNKRVERWWMAEKGCFYLTEKFDYFHKEKAYLESLKRPAAINLPQLWHVPPQNYNFVGRGSSLDRLSELLNFNVSAHVVACHGLGGVGKTQLVLQFAWSNLNNYKGIIWLDATDRNAFINEYIALGHELYIIREDDENYSIEIQAKRVKIWLEDPERAGWLMICDNAPNYKEVADLLPNRGGKMLFTSRYDYAWPQSKNTIAVDVFDPEESRNLIQSMLEEDDQSLDLLLVDELSKTLGHLPLALAQASAYIKKTQMRIGDYLNFYNIRKQALLSSNVLLETWPAGCIRESTAIVYVTWDFTMSKIQKISSLAANWLTQCAYFNSNDIPITLLDVFSSIPENNPSSECYHEALGILKCYSMITINKEVNSMSVHKLVQEVTFLKSKEKGESENDLRRALNLIKLDILANPKCAIDHALSVWNYGSKFFDLVTEFCELPSNIISALAFQVRYQEAFLFGSKAIALLQKKMGSSHYSTLSAMDSTAQVLNEQGKYEEAVCIYREIFNKRSETFGPDHKLTLTAKNRIANTLTKQGKYDEALKLLTTTMQKFSEDFGNQCFETLNTKQLLAHVLYEKGKYNDALRICEDIFNDIENKNEISGLEDSFSLSLKNFKAVVYDGLGKYDKALTLYKEVLEKLQSTNIFGLFHPVTLTFKQNIGLGYLKTGEYEKALKFFKSIIEIESRPDVLGPDHPSTLTTMGNLAAVLNSLGKFSEALKVYKEIFEKRLKLLGCYHPSTLHARHDMASLLDHQGKYDEALSIHDENIAHLLNIFGPDHPQTFAAKNNMAVLLIKVHKFDDALQIYTDVYNIQKKTDSLGLLHPHTLTTRSNMASVLDKQGKHSEACEIFQEVIEIVHNFEVLGCDHPLILSMKDNMATALSNLGKYDEALELYKEVSEKRTKILGPDHPFTLTTMNNMASALDELGKCDEALNLYMNVYHKRTTILGSSHPYTLATKHNIAFLLENVGKYDESLILYKDIFHKQSQALGQHSVESIGTKLRIAHVLAKRGNYNESFETYKDVLTAQTLSEELGPSHTSTIATKYYMAEVLKNQEKFEEALHLYEEVYRTTSSFSRGNNYLTINAKIRMVEVLDKLGIHNDLQSQK